MPKSAIPFFITVSFTVMIPAISIAPQKLISPSPKVSSVHQYLSIQTSSRPSPCEKCKSPTLNLAPVTWTGRYTLLPRLRFLISQFPPCSGLPGTVLAPSLPTLALISPSALPAWTLCGSGAKATSRSSLLAEISSPSRLFHVARTSAEGAHPRMPGWINPGNRTCGMCREEQKIPSKSQIALALHKTSC